MQALPERWMNLIETGQVILVTPDWGSKRTDITFLTPNWCEMVLTIDLVLEELTSCPNIPEIHFYGNENTPNWCKKELPEQAAQRTSLF